MAAQGPMGRGHDLHYGPVPGPILRFIPAYGLHSLIYRSIAHFARSNVGPTNGPTALGYVPVLALVTGLI